MDEYQEIKKTSLAERDLIGSLQLRRLFLLPASLKTAVRARGVCRWACAPGLGKNAIL